MKKVLLICSLFAGGMNAANNATLNLENETNITNGSCSCIERKEISPKEMVDLLYKCLFYLNNMNSEDEENNYLDNFKECIKNLKIQKDILKFSLLDLYETMREKDVDNGAKWIEKYQKIRDNCIVKHDFDYVVFMLSEKFIDLYFVDSNDKFVDDILMFLLKENEIQCGICGNILLKVYDYMERMNFQRDHIWRAKYSNLYAEIEKCDL